MMRIITIITISALAFATLALSACASTNNTQTKDQAASPIGSWSLARIENKRYDLPQGARTPTLTITAQGDISGQAGINRYSGKTDAKAMNDGKWNSGGIVMTRMAGEPQAMAFEQRFVSMLQRADTIKAGPEWLELRIGTRELLRFSRAGQ